VNSNGRRLRIVHVTPLYHPSVGGAQTHIRAISERLAARGHEVYVFTVRPTGSPELGSNHAPSPAELINGVHVRRFRPTARLAGVFGRLMRVPVAGHRLLRCFLSWEHIRVLGSEHFMPRSLLAVLRLKPDILTVINWADFELAYPFARLRVVGRFAFVGLPLFHTAEQWSHSPLYPALLDRCDAVLANTEHEQRFIQERMRRLCPVYAVGAGLDSPPFARRDGRVIRARYGVGGEPVVGYVGRLQATKGTVGLLDAMRHVWARDERVRLVLAGKRYPLGSILDAPIERALADLNVAERARVIHIDGFEEQEKASVFDAMDVYAMPSIAESFGIAYLEAWMCEKPVIGARIGSTQCVIREGVDGLLVDPDNPEDIAAAILRLLGDRELRLRMGRAGLEKTLSRFTWDKITDRVEQIYLDLVASKQSAG
jgi:glycosyltransferase involved in cell wall biosynthesis